MAELGGQKVLNRPDRRPVILIITDSLAFPRTQPSYVHYSQTYIALLRKKYVDYDIIHCGIGGATIGRLFNHSEYYHETVQPDLCIIHSGVVDCAPRTLTEVEQQIIRRLPVIGHPIGRVISRFSRQIRAIRKMSYTTPEVFEQFVQRFEAVFDRVCWIKIAPVSAAYEAHVPGMARSAAQFNAILERSWNISLDDFGMEEIMSDFHHLTAQGHGKIFERVSEMVNDLINMREEAE